MTFMVHSMQQFEPQSATFFIHLISYHLTKSLKKPEPKTRINITLPLIKNTFRSSDLPSDTHYVLEMCILEKTSTHEAWMLNNPFVYQKFGGWKYHMSSKIKPN
jgi:hypothetical protein